MSLNPVTTGMELFVPPVFNPQAVGMAVAQNPKCHHREI